MNDFLLEHILSNICWRFSTCDFNTLGVKNFITSSSQLRTLETWWRHEMDTFSTLLALCEGNLPVTGGFLWKASDAELWCFLWSAPEQSRRRWFETSSSSLWRHYKETMLNERLYQSPSVLWPFRISRYIQHFLCGNIFRWSLYDELQQYLNN